MLRRDLIAATLGLAVFALPAAAAAQDGGYHPPDLAAQRAAMARLAGLVGEWSGEAQVRFPSAMTVYQTERVESALDGLALIIRGTGHADAARAGASIYQALAVITYDDRRGGYDVRAYNSGHAGNAVGEFLDDGRFRWSLQAGPMQMRFTIALSENGWVETGEASRDGGQTWAETVALNLTRTR